MEVDTQIVKASYSKHKSKIEELTFVSKLKTHKIPIFVLSQSNDMLLLNILKINQLLTTYMSFKKLPFELITRKLFKNSVMTLGYSAGSTSRIAGFKEYIRQGYIELGYHKILITEPELNLVAEKLEEYYCEREAR